MGIFEVIYNWALELVGYSDSVPSEWLLPQFALLLSYIIIKNKGDFKTLSICF